MAIDWSTYTPPVPRHLGVKVFDDYSLAEIAKYIDWTPFFHAWGLPGRYPAILEDARVGEEARRLFADAQAMLRRVTRERLLEARAVLGLFAANAVGDDVEIYRDGDRQEVWATFHFLRQQIEKAPERPNMCLADFVAPRESGVADWLGAFAVTAGLRIQETLARFEAEGDDYSVIMLKALADRLAEAFAEHLHQRVRRESWGYATEEAFNLEALIHEQYQGHPPRAGLPGLPRSQREAPALGGAAAGSPRSHGIDGDLRHAARGVGMRVLLLASPGRVLRRGTHPGRPGRGLRAPQGHGRGRGGTLAGAHAGL